MIPIIDDIKKYLEPLEVYDRNGNKYLLAKQNQYICPTYCGVLHIHRIDTFIGIDTSLVELLANN
tara:strand:- start:43 stop:237 length:195 start_codon:yes stop_codon:yes gene_type:complete